jgi:hypothetical protein
VGAKFNGVISQVLNATLPTASGGKPTAWTAYSTTSAMLVRLNSTLSTASAEGTQIASGNGYTTGGTALGASTPSSAGSGVSLPASTTTWTCALSGGWSIASTDITDATPTATWFGAVTGQPVAVANGNSFAFSASALSASDS